MRECIWHQYCYKNWKWKILFNFFRLIGLDGGEVWSNLLTIQGRGKYVNPINQGKYTLEINESDMGRRELLIIRENF